MIPVLPVFLFGMAVYNLIQFPSEGAFFAAFLTCAVSFAAAAAQVILEQEKK